MHLLLWVTPLDQATTTPLKKMMEVLCINFYMKNGIIVYVAVTLWQNDRMSNDAPS